MVNVEEVARGAREGSRLLQDLKSEERSAVLLKIALLLEQREEEILAANSLDIVAAEERYRRKHIPYEMSDEKSSLISSLSLSLSPSHTHTHTYIIIISGLSGPSLHRLHLTHSKVMTLVDGIRSIALQDEPIGQVPEPLNSPPFRFMPLISFLIFSKDIA